LLLSFIENKNLSVFYLKTINQMIIFRCATGESWQAVMLACKSGVECQVAVHTRHYQANGLPINSSHLSMPHGKGNFPKCGSDFAYLYFCSFVFLSSFLVSKFRQNRN
jgi:hypothetical protein